MQLKYQTQAFEVTQLEKLMATRALHGFINFRARPCPAHWLILIFLQAWSGPAHPTSGPARLLAYFSRHDPTQ